MGLLNDLKNHQGEAENERMQQAAELLKVREELLETKKLEESARKEQQIERRRHREEVDRISQERTLKESELMSQLKEKESLLDSHRQMLTDR